MGNVLRRVRLVRGEGLTLGTAMELLAATHADRVLVTEELPGGGERSLTYRDAAEVVDRWAGGVAARTAPRDAVVVALPNGYDFLLACLAVARAGAVPVPVNPNMRPDEIDHVVDDARAGWVVREVGELDDAAVGTAPQREAVPSERSDIAAIFYTSGTTGKPKGARLTHAALVGQMGRAALYPSMLRDDVAVVALPVAHIMGFAVLLGLAGAGIAAHLLPRFDASRVLDVIEERRTSMFVGVPSMYRMLLDAGAEQRDLSSIRVWGSGADAMPADLAKRFQRLGGAIGLPVLGKVVGPAAFVEGYGMVELAGAAAFRISLPGLDRLFGDSLGRALPGFRLRVVDDEGNDLPAGEVGELLVKGPGVLRDYHGNPGATAEAVTPDGWLRTGDLARRGPLGLVSFAGRKKDVIKRGGFSVFSVEVEQALECHPDVAEAAVVGLADERSGEVPAAAVRLVPGSSLTGDELVAWAREQMSGYKVPARVVVVDDLPRTGTSKVQKAELRDLFAS